ncbi:hypothetical protein Tco_0108989 [Tanacetum coccineum]
MSNQAADIKTYLFLDELHEDVEDPLSSWFSQGNVMHWMAKCNLPPSVRDNGSSDLESLLSPPSVDDESSFF